MEPALEELLCWTRCVGDDLEQVLRIETISSPCPWTEDDFQRWERGHTSSVGVVKFRQTVFGFCVFSWDRILDNEERSNYTIENMTVSPYQRHQGVGTYILNKLKQRFETAGRPGRKIMAVVPDRNLSFIRFLQFNRFRAVGVLHDHFDPGVDGYRFQWVCGEDSPVWRCKNRITKFY